VDDMSFQKLLFLKGGGGNGKGTLARVLTSIHDPEAVSAIAVTDLGDERKRSSLVGKLVNVSGEQSRLQTIADTYLKKITGGDPIDIRKLYGETEPNVRLSVRFIELVNEMPATSDTSDALRRRMIILNCPNKVTNPCIHMDAKLLAERAGILLRWVRALQRLYARGEFDIPQSSIDQVDEYLRENDLVRMWVEDRCEDTDAPVDNGDLYGDFRGWLDANGFTYKVSSVSWGKRMCSLGYPSKRERIGKIITRCRGLRVRPGTTSFM
jgi:P4 family phage/plasmid primase-like protien